MNQRSCTGCGLPLSRYNVGISCQACVSGGRAGIAASAGRIVVNGRKLAELRRSRGWTQSFFADQIGFSVETVKKLEQNSRGSTRLGTLNTIAQALDVPLTVLLESASPLRELRRRRGLTLEVLAGRSGLSTSFLSAVETGKRRLTRFDHISAIASALGVAPSELAPGSFQGFDEWVLAASSSAADPFPAICDELTVKRHRGFAEELMRYVMRGDGYAAGEWLRRIARDPNVSPWLLLDQLAMRQLQSSPRTTIVIAGKEGN